MDLIIPGTPAPDAVAALKVGLRVMHLVGLSLGLGGATLLELIVLRFLVLDTVLAEHCRIIAFSSRIVAVGLALLWISGLGLLLHYGLFEPERLGNPKLLAKVTIVAVLTLNGALLHRFVLPFTYARVGQRLLHGVGSTRRSLLLTTSVVSAVSWYGALLIGSIPQLNVAVPAWAILAAYGVALAGGAAVAHGIASYALRSGEQHGLADPAAHPASADRAQLSRPR